MDVEDQIRLNRKWNEIIETVTFKYIAVYLIRDKVIKNEEFQLITLNPTTQSQMDAFLQLLVTKKSAFKHFVLSLEEDYMWLAEDLKNQVVSDQEIESFQKKMEQMQYIRKLNDTHHVNSPKPKGQPLSIKIPVQVLTQFLVLEICVDVITTLQQNARLVRRWTSLAYRFTFNLMNLYFMIRGDFSEHPILYINM